MVAFRKDDGNVTGKAEVVERSTDKEPNVAQNKSLELALTRASSSVIADTLAEWKANYGNAGAYMVLLTYADRNQTSQFQRHIEMTLGRGTRAYLKSWFGTLLFFLSQPHVHKTILKRRSEVVQWEFTYNRQKWQTHNSRTKILR